MKTAFPTSDIENGRILASDLAKWYWCAEKSYLSCRGVREKPKFIFKEGHRVQSEATRPPQTKDEIAFFDKLNKMRPFVREIEGIKIFVGADAFNLSEIKNNLVRLVEIKSRSKDFVSWDTIAPAEFQLEIYGWVYEPIIKKLGYNFSDEHYVLFISMATGELLKNYVVRMDYDKIEAKIRDCIVRLKSGEGIIQPKAWKCEYCDENLKRACRFQRDSANIST